MLGKIAQSSTCDSCGHVRPASSRARRTTPTMPSPSYKILLRASACFLLLAISLAGPRAGAQSAPPEYLFAAQNVPGPSGTTVAGIATYTVDTTTGALTPIAAAPVQPRGQEDGSLAINSAGTMLFQTTINSASLDAVGVFSIASDGSLTEVPNSPFGVGQSGDTLVLIAVSPNGKFLYLAFESSDVPPSTIVDVFAIAADGSLSLNNEFTFSAVEFCAPPTPARLTPVQFYIHPTQKSLFLFMGSSFGSPCSGQPSEVQPFTIDSDGTLTAGTCDNSAVVRDLRVRTDRLARRYTAVLDDQSVSSLQHNYLRWRTRSDHFGSQFRTGLFLPDRPPSRRSPNRRFSPRARWPSIRPALTCIPPRGLS